MSITKLLSSTAYLSINKYLARELGIVTASFLSELASEYNYYQERGMLEDNWFFSTTDNIEKNIGLSRRQQERAIKDLIDRGLIQYKKTGVPPKKTFLIMEDNLENLLMGDKLKCTKRTNCNVQNEQIENVQNVHYINNNNLNNNKYNKNKEDIEYIIGFLNEKTQSSFRTSTKKYQTLIKTLLEDEYTIQDFEIVIDYKVHEWLNDSRMSKYLTPMTLFNATKFPTYLNQAKRELNRIETIPQYQSFDDIFKEC